MKERPILFSGAMVRGVLAGDKTQTRRPVKPQPPAATYKVMQYNHPDHLPNFYAWVDTEPPGPVCEVSDWSQACPYGQPGDRIWVRETVFAWGMWEQRYSEEKGRLEWHFVDMTIEGGFQYRYASDEPHFISSRRVDGCITWWKRPAIHAPRAASRILLEITGVRVERLQDISEADAAAEGVATWAPGALSPEGQTADPSDQFRWLWGSINGADSWTANPWVWVVEFRRIKG
ncbi:hypothetical protein [Herbaspirillum chlorophenolicum]|uniref:hypothetical protein n=1 Tax=Herbaspirillum chlorophenolicum TaxID=211589 RepID=UPI00067D9C9A|nr:hypothetical protein [Herbaspirillum chlorophenolicum]